MIFSGGVLGPRVGAVAAPCVRVLLTERAQIPAVDACGGGQRGRRSEQAEGRRAHAPTRAPHPGLLPMSPRVLEPRALRLESSPRAEPAHFSHHCIYQTACERVSPSP